AVRPLLAGLVVEIAALGRDGEARRHVELGFGHVGEAGPLAADQVFDIAGAVGLAFAEEVDKLLLGRGAHDDSPTKRKRQRLSLALLVRSIFQSVYRPAKPSALARSAACAVLPPPRSRSSRQYNDACHSASESRPVPK